MRRLIPIMALLCVLVGNSYAQVGIINRVEYYIDTDPGYGLATPIPITQDTVVDTSYVVDLTGVSDGLHIFYIRAQNDSGWSIQHSQPFLRINSNPPPKIEQIEYFIDTDPGYGNATSIAFTNDTLVDITQTLNLTGVTEGVHTINVRAQDSTGNWTVLFEKPFLMIGGELYPDIDYLEYYVDTDPGFGNANFLNFTPDSLIDLDTLLDISGLSPGIHTLNVRGKTTNDQWTVPYTRPILISQEFDSTKIVKLEYYVDTDPGFGNAIDVPIGEDSIVDKSFLVDLNGLSHGIHIIGVRGKDNFGNWSSTVRYPFLIDGKYELPEIVAMEYFVDTDPGYGNATPILVSSNTLIDTNFVADISGLFGNHKVYVRALDTNGQWSITYVYDVCVGPPVNLGPDTLVCGNQYTLDAGFYSTYNWSTGETTRNVTFDSSGVYWIEVVDGNGCVSSDTVEINFNQAGFTHVVDSVFSRFYGYNASSPNVTSFYWDFGDGTYSNEENPVHQYHYTGYYDVCLSTFDSLSECSDRTCEVVFMRVDTALSNRTCYSYFGYDVNGSGVTFNNKSKGDITDFLWEFGDEATSTLQHPEHTYYEPGIYEVCLTVYDSANGCINRNCVDIEIVDSANVLCRADYTYFIENTTVHFTNVAQGNYTQVLWEFGDGAYSTEEDPKHVFSQPGYYEVCLTIYDENSGCLDDYCKVIHVIDTSATNCNAEFTQYIKGNTLFLTDDSEGNITHRLWEFGDGYYSSSTNPNHTYSKPDFYEICLTVYDENSGCMDEICKVVRIYDTTQIMCSADFTKFVENTTVSFNAKTEGNISNYFWNFGDKSFSYDKNPVHTFDKSDFYEVCLTVYDSSSGCLDERCRMVQIIDTTAEMCNADFTKIISDAKVNFTDNSDGNITNYFWSFGDGEYDYTANPTHTYKRPNYYEVCLSVFDNISECLDERCKVLLIEGEAFTSCKAKFSHYTEENRFVFTDESIGNISSYFWSFGDGNYAYTANPEHTYSVPDFYEVCQIVYDENSGCLDEYCKIVQVVDENVTLCEAEFSYYGEQRDVTFTDQSYGSITDYFWDFGDGKYAYTANADHTYEEPGYYNVNLAVFDQNSGCLDEYSHIVAVIDTVALDTQSVCNAKFTYYTQHDTVSFEPKALGEYSEVFWDFGDGFNSNVTKPVHIYEEDGYYDVYLTVMDEVNGCFDSRTKEVYVSGEAKDNQLSARFYHYPDSNSLKVSFEDRSFGNPNSWYWDFGDSSAASSNQHPSYTYSESGYYRVCLTVGNGGNDQKTRCKNVTVGNVSGDLYSYFTYFADSITSTGHFRNESQGDVDSYLWDFGDGVTSQQKNPSHTFADTGFYAVCLTVINTTTGESDIYCRKVRIGNAIENPCVFSCVWPGDANNDLEANHYDIMTLGLNFGMTGPARDSVSNRWIGHYGQDWSTYQLDGTNNKHGDCNGDGVIDWEDTLAVSQNFAYSHYPQPGSKQDEEWEVDFEWDDSKATTRRKGKVQLGPPVKRSKATIYALGYEVEVLGADDNMVWEETSINFTDNWMGTSGSDLITYVHKDSVKHKFYFGLAKNDGEGTTGDGTIAEIDFALKEGFDFNSIVIKLTSLGGIESDGSKTYIGGNLRINLGEDIDLCEGETADLSVMEGFDSYAWSSGETTSSIEVTSSGTYTVTVTDTSGMTGTDEITVTVHDNPVVDLGEDIESASDVTLDAGGGFATYSWSTGESNQTIEVTESGTYSVTVTDDYGCTGEDEIEVTITASGIIEESELAELSVYPVPAEEVIFVEVTAHRKGRMALELVDQNGARFYRQKLGKVSHYNSSVNVSRLARGIYYLQVLLDDKVVGIKKVVIH